MEQVDYVLFLLIRCVFYAIIRNNTTVHTHITAHKTFYSKL